jgi:hypothetical protein
MTCGRSTTAATYVIEGLFGWLPYGRVTNRLHCRKGCGDRFGMVLPLDAPTPRAFAEKYDLTPAPTAGNEAFKDIEGGMRDRLVEIGKGGTFLKVHAKAEEPAILHWGFDFLLSRVREGDIPPHLAVTHGAQWSRDSQRDYKIVSTIPYKEWPSGPRNDASHIGSGPKKSDDP